MYSRSMALESGKLTVNVDYFSLAADAGTDDLTPPQTEFVQLLLITLAAVTLLAAQIAIDLTGRGLFKLLPVSF